MQIGDRFRWHGQEYMAVETLPRGTPIACDLGNLGYDGTTYAVCTAPRQLIFHYTFIVIHKGYSSLVAVVLGEH